MVNESKGEDWQFGLMESDGWMIKSNSTDSATLVGYSVGFGERFGFELVTTGHGYSCADILWPISRRLLGDGVVPDVPLVMPVKFGYPGKERTVEVGLRPVHSSWYKPALSHALRYWGHANFDAWHLVPEMDFEPFDMIDLSRPFDSACVPGWYWYDHEWRFNVHFLSHVWVQQELSDGAPAHSVTRVSEGQWALKAADDGRRGAIDSDDLYVAVVAAAHPALVDMVRLGSGETLDLSFYGPQGEGVLLRAGVHPGWCGHGRWQPTPADRTLSKITDPDTGIEVLTVEVSAVPRFSVTRGLTATAGFELITAGSCVQSLTEERQRLIDTATTIQRARTNGDGDGDGDGGVGVVDESWTTALSRAAGLDVGHLQQVLPAGTEGCFGVPDMSVVFDIGTDWAWRWLIDDWPYPIARNSQIDMPIAVLTRQSPLVSIRRDNETHWTANPTQTNSNNSGDGGLGVVTVPVGLALAATLTVFPMMALNVGDTLNIEPVTLDVTTAQLDPDYTPITDRL